MSTVNVAMLNIQGKMPGLNDYIEVERKHRQLAAKMKRLETERVAWAAKSLPVFHSYFSLGSYSCAFS